MGICGVTNPTTHANKQICNGLFAKSTIIQPIQVVASDNMGDVTESLLGLIMNRFSCLGWYNDDGTIIRSEIDEYNFVPDIVEKYTFTSGMLLMQEQPPICKFIGTRICFGNYC